jgi:signal transduction histidine kinase
MKALRKVWKILTDPRSADPDEARREYITRTILTMMIMALIAVTAVILVGWAADAFTPESVVTILLLDLWVALAGWLTYRRQWAYATYLLPPIFVAHTIYATYTIGFGSWPLASGVLAIMLTGMLHGTRLQWYMVGLTTMFYGITAWLHGDRAPDLMAVGITMAAILFSSVTLLQWLFTSQLERANRQLKQQVEERRRVEETLRKTQNQLVQAQKLEAIGRLAGGVAHDFNNLLTVVELSARLMGRQMHQRDPLWEHQPVNLSHLIRELSRMLQRIIGEDVDLFTDLADELWSVEVDPSQMEQVIVNLAVNARDAMPLGGRLTIETANEVLSQTHEVLPPDARCGDYVLIRVSDNGTGMDDEVKDHLFEPFFSTKTGENGTGLGLPTVYGVVRQNQGYIGLESQVGQGTTFSIYLPRSQGGMPGTPAEPSPRPVTAALAAGTETILIVEDEGAVLGLARQILEEQGYHVLTARNGLQALQVSREYGGIIHLLLTDIIMPEINGRQLAEQLRSARPDVRVLYMSGYSDDVLAHHNIPGQGVALLAKPFSMDTLIHKVRGALDGH